MEAIVASIREKVKELVAAVRRIWRRLELALPFTTDKIKTGRLRSRNLFHSLLSHHFSLHELHQLAFEVDIDTENLAVPDNDKDGLVRAIIVSALNEGRFNALIAAAQVERPLVDWPQLD